MTARLAIFLRPARLTAAVAALVLTLAGGMGCSRSLFRDPPRARDSIGKYYGGDSATAATEARRRGSSMGFGFPSGAN